MDTTYSHSYFGTESHEALECLPVQQRVSLEGFPKTRRNKPLEYVSPPGMASKYILSLPLPKILRPLDAIREKVACIQKYLINSIDLLFFGAML